MIFSGRSHLQLAQGICEELQTSLSPSTIKEYRNGCFEVIFEQDVLDKTVFLVQTSPPDNLERHLWELLEMVGSAKNCGASEIIVVMPYVSYARSDKVHRGGMGVTADLMVKLLESSGMTGFLGVDFHSERFKNFFSCPVYHLSALDLLVQSLRKKNLENSIVLPADQGAFSKGAVLAEKLQIPLGRVEKKRISDTEVRIENIMGDFKQKQVIIFDDEIATGGTLKTLAEKIDGARNIIFAVTHGLFVGNAVKNFGEIKNLTEIIVTDTVPVQERSLPLTVLSVSGLLAEKIKELTK